jgi:hypothetical protein
VGQLCLAVLLEKSIIRLLCEAKRIPEPNWGESANKVIGERLQMKDKEESEGYIRPVSQCLLLQLPSMV